MAEDEKNQVKEHKNGTDVNKVSEPTESDPCIEEKPQKLKIWYNAESVIREKTGLSKEGVRYLGALVIVTLLTFIIIIALGIAWPTIPHHQRFPVCIDSACLRASAQVREALNSSVSPCADLWGWACGGWLTKYTLPEDKGIWDQKQQLAKQEAALIRELVTTLPLPLHMGTLEWKLKYFYEACMDVDTIEIDNERPLTTIISELGGWYIMKNWNLEDFDSKNLLKDLHVKYGVTPFFKISVDPNPGSPGNSSIRISPAGLGLPDRRYYYSLNNDDPIQAAYKQLIRDVVINFSATRAEAVRFGNDIFYYEKRIAEITPESCELEDPVYTYNNVKVSELKIIAPNLYFHDILASMFPEANIDEDTEVILTSQDYLSKISHIVSSTDAATMNSYMMWTLVKAYLPYLSSKFTSTWNSYSSELLGIKKPLERWEFCTNLLQKFMGFAVNVLLERRNSLSNSTRSVVTEMFDAIKKTIHKKLDKFGIMPNLHKHLSKKVQALSLQIGLPQVVIGDEYVKNYYKKLTVIKSTFFGNHKNGIVFLKKLEERRLVSYHPEDYTLAYSNIQPPRVHYSPAANTIIVPRSVLSSTYFEDKFPRPVLFGRLGIEIASAMVSSILPYDSAWTSDLKLLTQFHSIVNDSIRDVQYPRRCLSKFIVTNNLFEQEIADLTTLNTLKQLSALSIGEKALNVITSKSAHIHQPSLEKFEDSALYYLTFAQSLCSVSSRQHKMYEGIMRFKLPDESLLQVAWHNVPGFPKSVTCPYDEEAVCSDIF